MDIAAIRSAKQPEMCGMVWYNIGNIERKLTENEVQERYHIGRGRKESWSCGKEYGWLAIFWQSRTITQGGHLV